MRFGLIRLIFKKSSKPNQTKAAWIGSVSAVYHEIKKYHINFNIANLLQNKHRIFHFAVNMIKDDYT